MVYSGKGQIAKTVAELALPVAAQLGLELWDVEYVREGGQNYLRVYIDSPEGVTVEDTERMFRALDPLLDERDPIPESYCMEVSSPGVERPLRTDAHLAAFLGAPVRVRLYKARDGVREYLGELAAFDGEHITLHLPDGELTLLRSDIARMNVYYDYSQDEKEE